MTRLVPTLNTAKTKKVSKRCKFCDHRGLKCKRLRGHIGAHHT